jgi:glycosyltransferase involved in cell wall biosynthesis
MNVLFLSPDFLLPADRGLRVRELSQLRLLSAMSSIERISFLCLSETPIAEDTLRALEAQVPKVKAEPAVVHRARMRRSPSEALHLLRLRLMKREPYLIAKCDSPAMHALIRRHLRTRTYGLAYVGYIGMMAYAADVRRMAPTAGVVLEQHNVEWQIFERLAERMRPPLRQGVQFEARSLRGFERRAMRQADSVVAISETDAAGFRDLAGTDAVVVPPCIEPRGSRAESPEPGPPALGYIGTLAWQPNRFGLDWFCESVWPLVRQRLPEATLTIAGPGLTPRADGTYDLPAAWARPGIKAVGFLEDLEDLYRNVRGMVAPVVGGSGVRMKLLETMSAGMPTVTTVDGAAGLGVTDGREVLVADSPGAFADRVVRLLSDSALREHLRRGGYEYLTSRHSEPVTRASLERAIKAARAKRSPVREVFAP